MDIIANVEDHKTQFIMSEPNSSTNISRPSESVEEKVHIVQESEQDEEFKIQKPDTASFEIES